MAPIHCVNVSNINSGLESNLSFLFGLSLWGGRGSKQMMGGTALAALNASRYCALHQSPSLLRPALSNWTDSGSSSLGSPTEECYTTVMVVLNLI